MSTFVQPPALGCIIAMDLIVLYVDDEPPSTIYVASVRGVAVQVAFERRTLKPVFHLIGYRLWL